MNALESLPENHPRYAAILALSPADDDLTSSGCPYLLPLLDKTILQHNIELAVRCGVRVVDVLVSDGMHEVRQHVGNGERWGVNLRIHSVSDPCQWPRTLKTLLATHHHVSTRRESSGGTGAHVEATPSCNATVETQVASQTSSEALVLLLNCERLIPDLATRLSADNKRPAMWHETSGTWAGAAIVSFRELHQVSAEAANGQGFLDDLRQRVRLSGSEYLVSDSLSILPVENLLTAQRRVLQGDFPILTAHLRTSEPGVWIGRNTRLHPSTQIIGPVFIGSDCDIDEGVVLGPNAVVSQHSLLLQDTIAQDCLITSFTGVGEDLHLQDCIVFPNMIYNSRLKIKLGISDEVLTSDLRNSLFLKSTCTMAASLSATGARLLLSGPAFVYRLSQALLGRSPQFTAVEIQREFGIPGHGPYGALVIPKYTIAPVNLPTERRIASQWRDLFLRITPALRLVATGQMRWCGISPRTATGYRTVPDYWRETLQHQTPGLITEWLVQHGPSATEEQRLVCDVWMAVNQSRWNRLRLFARYLRTLLTGPESCSESIHEKSQDAVSENFGAVSGWKSAEAELATELDTDELPNDLKPFSPRIHDHTKDHSPCPI